MWECRDGRFEPRLRAAPSQCAPSCLAHDDSEPREPRHRTFAAWPLHGICHFVGVRRPSQREALRRAGDVLRVQRCDGRVHGRTVGVELQGWSPCRRSTPWPDVRGGRGVSGEGRCGRRSTSSARRSSQSSARRTTHRRRPYPDRRRTSLYASVDPARCRTFIDADDLRHWRCGPGSMRDVGNAPRAKVVLWHRGTSKPLSRIWTQFRRRDEAAAAALLGPGFAGHQPGSGIQKHPPSRNSSRRHVVFGEREPDDADG